MERVFSSTAETEQHASKCALISCRGTCSPHTGQHTLGVCACLASSFLMRGDRGVDDDVDELGAPVALALFLLVGLGLGVGALGRRERVAAVVPFCCSGAG